MHIWIYSMIVCSSFLGFDLFVVNRSTTFDYKIDRKTIQVCENEKSKPPSMECAICWACATNCVRRIRNEAQFCRDNHSDQAIQILNVPILSITICMVRKKNKSVRIGNVDNALDHKCCAIGISSFSRPIHVSLMCVCHFCLVDCGHIGEQRSYFELKFVVCQCQLSVICLLYDSGQTGGFCKFSKSPHRMRWMRNEKKGIHVTLMRCFRYSTCVREPITVKDLTHHISGWINVSYVLSIDHRRLTI